MELWWGNCLTLAVYQTLLSLGTAGPRWGTLSEHSPALLPVILLAYVHSSEKNKGRVDLPHSAVIPPAPWQHLLEKKCFAAKRFTVNVFYTPGTNSWRPDMSQQGDLVKTVIGKGMRPQAPG